MSAAQRKLFLFHKACPIEGRHVFYGTHELKDGKIVEACRFSAAKEPKTNGLVAFVPTGEGEGCVQGRLAKREDKWFLYVGVGCPAAHAPKGAWFFKA